MSEFLNNRPRFVMLKSINGEPMLVNVSSVRTVSTINMAGADFGVISFGKEHEVVIGSSVPEVVQAIEAALANNSSIFTAA
ncbi:hypothetical protein ACNFJ7_06305 [Sphingomonas sp. HT-1]|uniref:hypothetical protein n=1 Tax=unclassified Sphingomonas TaxID=196159 RepID=UPI0002EEF8CF|nr:MULTISPECIES: hypothetical protein [unclassified Sphingomonas]KTF69797.1 hypothetical protein ATB93_07520 [Sphingomonas sp. WG]